MDMKLPAAMSAQNRRIWPRLETAFPNIRREALKNRRNWTVSLKYVKDEPGDRLGDTTA